MQNTFLTDEGTLEDVLRYHVVPGTIIADQFANTESLDTLEGTSASFAMSADGVPMFEEAQVTTTDLMATNGVVHIIDTVALPPSQQMRELLLNHVIQGLAWSADDLASVNELPTIEDSIIEISVENDILTVGAANVTTLDIEASNGVIHAVDSVLLPN